MTRAVQARHFRGLNAQSGLCGERRIEGLYLIVGHVGRVELLVPQGADLVQLRIEGQPETEVRRQIARARDFCAVHDAQLVIHRHWQAALDLNCDFVHLTQQDLAEVDTDALHRAGVRYGVDVGDDTELKHALTLSPAYVALDLRALSRESEGNQPLEQLKRWKQTSGDVPLVVSGGLVIERLHAVFAAGADCVAVSTDIQSAEDPEARTRAWVTACGA